MTLIVYYVVFMIVGDFAAYLRPSKTWGSLVAALQRKPSLDILSGESHSHRQPGTSKDRSMPTHRKRPRDFSQAAKLVIDIATGQVEDRPPTPEERGKDPAAAALALKERAATTRTTDREFNRVWNEDQQASRLRHQHGLNTWATPQRCFGRSYKDWRLMAELLIVELPSCRSERSHRRGNARPRSRGGAFDAHDRKWDGRRYRKLAEMYWALALGEEPERAQSSKMSVTTSPT